ncbi:MULTISPECIES: efflux transporter outer membrane subunit [unclassified Phenylobacterium]|uniref:efflux transporter outer membrane subunit n=1 Tax=unclassified Phenylobacterium TaxID=2640670 RepID=UPI000AEC87F2|nr:MULTISPECIES: TolC family protein [unclassified Phenylobacterium]
MRLVSPAVGPVAGMACLMLLSACASTRDADTRVPAVYEAPVSPEVASAPSLETWWTGFNDPQLTALIEQALAASPDARSAAAKLREARATRSGALTSFLPQGNPRGSVTQTDSKVIDGAEVAVPGFSTAGDSETQSANFDVSWEIDLFGRIFAARRAANAEMAAARLDYEAARASLAAAVADGYFAARGLAIQLEDTRATERIQAELYRIVNIRAERGIASTADADRVAGDLAQARSQVTALEADLQAAQRNLLILTGRGIEPIASLPIDASVGVVPQVPAAVPGELLARRPDVRRAEAMLVSALGRLDYAKLAFFPTFKLAPGIGLQQNDQPSYSATIQSWTIGANVTVPVLDIPRLLTEMNAQDARAEQAAIAYEKAVQTAYGEAENSLVQLEADRRRIALLENGEERALRAYEASRKGYVAGFNDLQTTLDNERAWRTLRTLSTAAQVQGLRRAVQSYKALGGGWPLEAAPTNKEAR